MLEGMYDYLEKGEVVHSRSFDIFVGESFFAEKLTKIQGKPSLFLGIRTDGFQFIPEVGTTPSKHKRNALRKLHLKFTSF